MKAVILDVPKEMIEDRRRRGVDRYDEVWQGVYHMTPPPTHEHQRIIEELLTILKPYFQKSRLGILKAGTGVAGRRDPSKNYRIPDLFFVTEARKSIIKPKSSWIVDGPDVVFEVRSPGDETYEKLPFYAEQGIRELFVIDRDTCRVESFRLAERVYIPVSADRQGWTRSETMRCSFKTISSKLVVRLDLTGIEHTI